MVDEHATTYENPFKFSGKELDDITGLYDHGARSRDPKLTMWYGVDPLYEKYPDMSPYVYCAGNPVKFIDPDGMDEWEINEQGEIYNRIENKEIDVFYIVNEEGERQKDEEGEYKSISFEYGTVDYSQRRQARCTEDNSDSSNSMYDIYKLVGDDVGTAFFEFMAENTSVEWGHMKTGEAETGLNVITTIHERSSEYGYGSMFNDGLLENVNIREQVHSHPSNTGHPSGLPGGKSEGKGDIAAAVHKQIYYPDIKLRIFLPKSCSYVNYNKDSKKSDFK